MPNDMRPDRDQLQLQAGQRPVCHCLGQLDATQEGGQVVGQRVQLQLHLVVTEPLAWQPRPPEGDFAFFDVLLGGAALVMEPHHPVRLHQQVGAMKPTRGNSSLGCHSIFEITRRVLSQDAAWYPKSKNNRFTFVCEGR